MAKRTSSGGDTNGKAAKLGADELCIRTVRMVSADVVQKANSGHPGAPIGCAPMAHVLWAKVMNYSPSNPEWIARDRFVLSNGHGCALQYTMLHLTGYNVTMDNLKAFRQLGSNTPGHPENFMTAGVEVCTGPLGQGISQACGMALAQTHMAATFNKPNFPVFDNYTYVICGDGCMQEGVSGEACSLAGHLKLGRLIVLYDDNNITIDGATELSFSEDVNKRYEAYGWHVQTVEDGNSDHEAIAKAIEAAKAVTDKPSFIKVKTVIAFGAPTKQGTSGSHGAPLGAEEIKNMREAVGAAQEDFKVPDEVYAHYKQAPGAAAEGKWNAMFAEYEKAHADLAAEIKRRFYTKELPAGWKESLPSWKAGDKALATRQASQQVLHGFAPKLPEFMGGSADLTPSTLTKWNGAVDYSTKTPEGRYVRWGVREHGMAAMCNGMAAYGGLIPFASTFMQFTGYALGAVRLSSLSRFQVIYVMTHDSIGLGEDGPTHQPVEMLAQMRTQPNLLVMRPADGNECSGAYAAALENRTGPSLLCFSREGCEQLEGSSADHVAKGAYVLKEDADAKVTLVGSGSQMQLCLKAAKLLKIPARLVSLPCTQLFDAQSADYKASVFKAGVPTLSVEAASAVGVEGIYAHASVCMRQFGLSAPGGEAYKFFGFSPEGVAEKAEKLVAFYEGKAVPNLMDRLVFPAVPTGH
mmetsp:Transcript_40596/g.85894  ORF Transcript_40596/g.85894 Transcript_40596/m.85894 type:complete len:694 (-) Transcript_40596:128-2209(-)